MRIMARIGDPETPVLAVTDPAREKILEVRGPETDAETLGLGSGQRREQWVPYTYTMELRPLAEAGDADVVQRHDDLSVIVDGASIGKLHGTGLGFTGCRHGHGEPRADPAARALG